MKTTGFQTERLDTRAFFVPTGESVRAGDMCEDAPAPKAGLCDIESDPQ